jgi:hypothetical protein
MLLYYRHLPGPQRSGLVASHVFDECFNERLDLSLEHILHAYKYAMSWMQFPISSSVPLSEYVIQSDVLTSLTHSPHSFTFALKSLFKEIFLLHCKVRVLNQFI